MKITVAAEKPPDVNRIAYLSVVLETVAIGTRHQIRVKEHRKWANCLVEKGFVFFTKAFFEKTQETLCL